MKSSIPHPLHSCTKWHLWFPYNYAPIRRRLTTNCACLFLCVSACENSETVVCKCDEDFHWVESWLFVSCNVKLRNGLPGSNTTKVQKASNLKKYVAVVSLNLTASGDSHENSSHTDVCSMHCVSVVAGFGGQFMGLSEVPLEKKPDLKPAPGHLAERIS